MLSIKNHLILTGLSLMVNVSYDIPYCTVVL